MAVSLPDMDASWLREQLDQPGRSQSELSRYLGYEYPSVVNRMCRGVRQIKAWEADKIREYLEETKRPATEGRGPAAIARIAPVVSPISMLPVRGTVEAGSWREVALSDFGQEFESLPAPRSVVDSGTYALRVVGPSMNELYPDGSYVVVRPWNGGSLPYNKRVIVERSRDGLVETTVKDLVLGRDGEPELWPRSSHPDHQKPLAYKEDDTTVRLVGVVTWAIKPD